MVCPAIGLVGVGEYFNTFNWIWEESPPGTVLLKQTADPDLRSFDRKILHTTMTEMDVIKFCGVMGYVPMSLATQISTNLTSGKARQGLLASAPTLPPQQEAPALHVPQEDYDWSPQDDWTGCLSDIYNPVELNPSVTNTLNDSNLDLWNTTNMQDLQSLDTYLVNEGLGYGYLNIFSEFL
jgi:hypothetical protein